MLGKDSSRWAASWVTNFGPVNLQAYVTRGRCSAQLRRTETRGWLRVTAPIYQDKARRLSLADPAQVLKSFWTCGLRGVSSAMDARNVPCGSCMFEWIGSARTQGGS